MTIDKHKLSKVKKQIEYYFSNANFSKDKFLYEIATQNDYKVGIDVLLTFNKIKQMEVTADDIKNAITESNIVEICGDDIRKKDIEQFKEYLSEQNVNQKTVAMCGFNTDMTLEDIENYLNAHCKPVRILMRRRKQKEFSGTCFVEFSTVEEAENALKLELEIENEKEEDGKRIKTEPTKIVIKTKEDHLNASKVDRTKQVVDRIKNDFVTKLYHFITDKETVATFKDDEKSDKEVLTMKKVKEEVENAAFIDFKKNVVRLKYEEEWTEKEFKNFTLKKMTEEEAQTYVDELNIKVDLKRDKKRTKNMKRNRRDNKIKENKVETE